MNGRNEVSAEDSKNVDPAFRVKALESLLEEAGLIDPLALDDWVEAFETMVGPHLGAKVVARAWTDPEYKQRLLSNSTEALAELNVPRLQGEEMVFLENTRDVHNVVVCTLCSCYPWPLMGLPPNWYKLTPYRSRIVKEPRSVLAEFGFEVPDSIEVRVWDSNSEVRYMVLPMRPEGTEDLGVEELAALVTRDSMIGVCQATPPHDTRQEGTLV